MYIKINSTDIFNLPKSFRLDDGRLVTNFHLLTDLQRINLAQVYPVINEPLLQPWQSKSDPTYIFTETEALVTYTITDLLLDDYKQERIANVYDIAKPLLDKPTLKYGFIEVSNWYQLLKEIQQYNIDATVGSNMTDVIASSIHDAVSLSALLTPLGLLSDSLIANRTALTSALLAAIDHQAVADIDITLGW